MENQKEIEDKLWKIFANVNDWLKVAEAKNAMLIGFNGACIFGFSKIEDNYFNEMGWYFLMVYLLFGASLTISLLSFVPRLSSLPISFHLRKKSENIFFFEYLKTLNSKSLLDLHFKKNGDKGFPDSIMDLADQIINNSKITSLKYSYFTIAIWTTICGIVTPVFGAILFGYWYSHQIKS